MHNRKLFQDMDKLFEFIAELNDKSISYATTHDENGWLVVWPTSI